jgi:hypothetical protein
MKKNHTQSNILINHWIKTSDGKEWLKSRQERIAIDNQEMKLLIHIMTTLQIQSQSAMPSLKRVLLTQ